MTNHPILPGFPNFSLLSALSCAAPSDSPSPPPLPSSARSPNSWHYRESTIDLATVLANEAKNKTPKSHSPAPVAPAVPAVPKPRARSLASEFLLGGLATASACLFTNPIEVVKTRMQLEGELIDGRSSATRVYRHPFQAFVQIAKSEGISGLQGGLSSAMIYQIAMNSVRLGLYNDTKRLLSPLFGVSSPLPGSSVPAFQAPFALQVSSGMLCGVLSAVVGAPFFLVKVRLQVQANSRLLNPQKAVGVQHNYKGTFSGIYEIIKTEGPLGLYRGVSAAMLRVGIGSGVQLATYESSKRLIMENFHLQDSLLSHVGASLLSGLIVTFAMNPADVLSARMVNQKGTLYTGLLDCIQKTIRNEGVGAFYKGFLPHYLRMGPHTLLTFVFWEQLRKYA